MTTVIIFVVSIILGWVVANIILDASTPKEDDSK